MARFRIALGPGERFRATDRPAIALSRDGRLLAYVANRGSGDRIHLRSIGSFDATPLAGTDDASVPFFSPDGQWIGFWAGGQLKKVSVDGRTVAPIAPAANLYGAVWGSDDNIFFVSSFESGIQRVPAAGGVAQAVTTVNSAAADPEIAHHWPDLTPDGRTLLFAIGLKSHRRWDEGLIVAQSLQTGERKVIARGAAFPRSLPSGHLAYVRNGMLFGVPFDGTRLTATGPEMPLTKSAAASQVTQLGAVQFAASEDWFVYAGSERRDYAVAAIGRDGHAEILFRTPHPFAHARLSPDGSRVVVRLAGFHCDLWILDLRRGTTSRFTFEGDNHGPVWSRDGAYIFYHSDRYGEALLLRKRADGSGEQHVILKGAAHDTLPLAVTPDGRQLVYVATGATTKADIWSVAVDGSSPPKPFATSAFREEAPALSPDGRWLAYASDESGNSEVYVQPFPAGGSKLQVSSNGGVEPRWSANGREIFYRAGAQLMAAAVSPAGVFSANKPRVLFDAPGMPSLRLSGILTSNYDVRPDGSGFITVRPDGSDSAISELRVIVNWQEELRGKGNAK